jgi:hypothetical protein
MLSRWIYILVGNNGTGKTTFQRRLVFHLCGQQIIRLDRNRLFEVTCPNSPRRFKSLFTMSRSYQENEEEYLSVRNYFVQCFRDADVCILSSWATVNGATTINDVKEMMQEGWRRTYNVGGVFFTNCATPNTEDIAQLSWDERFLLDNPTTPDKSKQDVQLDCLARGFGELLVRRALHHW